MPGNFCILQPQFRVHRGINIGLPFGSPWFLTAVLAMQISHVAAKQDTRTIREHRSITPPTPAITNEPRPQPQTLSGISLPKPANQPPWARMHCQKSPARTLTNMQPRALTLTLIHVSYRYVWTPPQIYQ